MTTRPLGHEIDGAGRRYYDDVVLDNILESMLELTATVWAYHDRVLVLESVLDDLLGRESGKPTIAELVERHQPSAEEKARRRAEREALVDGVFRSFSRRPTARGPAGPGVEVQS